MDKTLFKIVDEDIFNATENYICHQCNCVSQSAAGLAYAMFKKLPWSDCYTTREEADVAGTINVRSPNSGKSMWELTSNPQKVVNMFAQYYPGGPGLDLNDDPNTRIKYFRRCLFEMASTLPSSSSYAFPWTIGCGIAGGDWGKYITILKNFEAYIHGDVTVYKLPERNQCAAH